jgi:YidC/Oxa1 family membrane protein insertase
VAGQPLPLSISVSGVAPVPADLRYAVASQSTDQVTFVGRTADWEVTKHFAFSPAGFELNVTVVLRNLSVHPLSGELGVHQARAIDPTNEEKPSMFGGVGNLSDAVCLVKDSLQKMSPSDKRESKDYPGPVSFAGVNQQYFLSAVFPVGAAREGRCTVAASPVARESTAWFPVQVAPGETLTQSFGAFLGPKDS